MQKQRQGQARCASSKRNQCPCRQRKPPVLAAAPAPALLNRALPPFLGLALLVVLWSIVARGDGIPGPIETWKQAVDVFSDPFYRNGPNDQGVGWNVLASLERVSVGLVSRRWWAFRSAS